MHTHTEQHRQQARLNSDLAELVCVMMFVPSYKYMYVDLVVSLLPTVIRSRNDLATCTGMLGALHVRSPGIKNKG